MPNKHIFIFDLDGTLADISHRRHLVENGNHRWDEFYAECINDKPNQPVIDTYKALERSGYKMVIFSGRSDVVKEQTMQWLKNNGIHEFEIYMRLDKDYTPDQELKLKWLSNLNKEEIIGVFDDRDKVVAMWREQGLTCFQVAPGNF